uniref:Solute carrier family 38 member 8b n=1 Tax=Neogobius melanostomus TaxID=47308 RepID=A0A8C6UHU6_9GOBI
MEELARESICLFSRSASHTDPPRLGSFGAVFIMLKSALGAGLLNFPWAFEKAGGVTTAITVEMVSLVFLISGLVILGYASSISRQKTYQDVVREVCGRAVGQLCEVCFCFNLFMICVAFLVVVQDQLEKLCISLYETATGLTEAEMPYNWYTDQRFALFLMCLIIILPLSIPKEIGIQKYTSVLGTLAATYLCVAVIVKYYLMESHTSRQYHSFTFNRFLIFFVNLQCHEAFVSMFFCLLVYTLTGVYGFMTFGRDVASDILISVILNLLLRFRRRSHGIVTSSFESRCRIVLTVIWITVTLLIAMFVPDMGEVISVIGGISAFFIFIFPGKLLSLQPVGVLTIWGIITIVVGTFIFGQSTTIAIMELINKF